MQTYTAAIIGAGPLGIELAAAFKKIGVSYIQFDKGQVAQMIANFPLQTKFFSSSEKISIAGIPIQTIDQQKCSREEYLAYIRSVVMHYGLKINSYETVTKIERSSKKSDYPYHLETTSKLERNHYICRYLVIASGGTSTPRMLGVKGEDLPHVSTKLQDPHQYFQKKVVVIGGKNSAVESALRCFHAGALVSLVIRKEQLDPQEVKYWLLPEISGCISKGEIALFPHSEVREITPRHILIKKISKKAPIEIETDFVIKALGFEADMSLFHQLNLPLIEGEQNRPLYDTDTMETPSRGVFVLGTVTGGTQKKYRVFIENCHDHISKIMRTVSEREGIPLREPLFNLPIPTPTAIHLEE